MQNDLLLRAARGEHVERPPVWIMRQAGRYLPEYNKFKNGSDFFDLCRTPTKAATITLQPVYHYPHTLDAAIIFSDILVVPQALGMEVEMRENQGPVFLSPLRNPNDINQLNFSPQVTNELGYVLEAIKLTRKELNGRVPLLGFVGAPWTLLVYMIEGSGSKIFQHVKHWIYSYPEECHKVLNLLTNICIEFLVEQIKAGAQMVQVFDSWAGELGPQEFQEFSLPYLTRIAYEVPKKLKSLNVEPVPMTVFPKGAWYSLEMLDKTNYDVISLDWLHDPKEARKRTSKVLQGNLDPGTMYGSDEVITKKTNEMIRNFGVQKYIVNFGHGTSPFMSPEKIGHFLQVVNDFKE